MKILVSACLLGQNCKYSGGNNRCEAVLRYCEGHDVIPVCPEQLGGLPTPRVPAEIVDGTVTTKTGENVDAAFRLGAEKALRIALDAGADFAILQPRSPSCGASRVYDGTFTGTLRPGRGVFAQLLMEHHIPACNADEPEIFPDL